MTVAILLHLPDVVQRWVFPLLSQKSNSRIINKQTPFIIATGFTIAFLLYYIWMWTSVSVSPLLQAISAIEANHPPDFPEQKRLIKAAFSHAWRNYVSFAFGADELLPISRKPKDWLGLGATVTASLDTLLLMELNDNYDRATSWIWYCMGSFLMCFPDNRLDFRQPTNAVNVSEVSVRVLGGLLGAFAISGDRNLIEKAIIIGDLLLPAFQTPTGIPFPEIHLRSGVPGSRRFITLKEIGSTLMEFDELSFLTGKPKYSNAANKAIEAVLSRTYPKRLHDGNSKDGYHFHYVRDPKIVDQGLLREMWDPLTGEAFGRFGYGPKSDTFYEYLLKDWLLSNGKKHESDGSSNVIVDGVRRIYTWREALKGINEHILSPRINGHRYVGSCRLGTEKDHLLSVDTTMYHFSCSLPGYIALGAPYVGNYSAHMRIAEEIIDTCVFLHTEQKAGLAPEAINYMAKGDSVPIDPRYLLRPETLESLWIVYRETKEPQYRKWAWRIFEAIERNCWTPTGYTGLQDVNSHTFPPPPTDVQESYLLSETFKYLYLMFIDETELEELLPRGFVMTTEGHAFSRHVMDLEEMDENDASSNSKSKDDLGAHEEPDEVVEEHRGPLLPIESYA